MLLRVADSTRAIVAIGRVEEEVVKAADVAATEGTDIIERIKER
jgi:hypothetical protein